MELRLKKRRDGNFEPFDFETRRNLEIIEEGQVITYIHVKKRNHKNLQHWQVFCKESFAVQKKYDTLEVWKKILCIACGHTDVVTDKNGFVQYLPNRMDYKECDSDELFKKLFKKSVNWFLKNHCGSMSDERFLVMLEFDRI